MNSFDLGDGTRWQGRNAIELIVHLEQTHHLYLRHELPRVTDLHRRVTRAHGWEHPELFAIGELFEELRLDLEPHVAKEERVLFPLVRTLHAASTLPSFDCGSIANPIAVMVREHTANRDLFRLLRETAHDFTPPLGASDPHQALLAALARLEHDTEIHHRKENDVLFPAVLLMEARLADRAS